MLAQGVRLRGIAFSNESEIDDIEREANELLSSVVALRDDSTSISKSTWWAQGVAYCILGDVAMARQDHLRALYHFNKFKNESILCGFDVTDYEVINVERQIQQIQAFGAGEIASNETIAKLQKTCLKETKKKFGESSCVAIDLEVLLLAQAMLDDDHNNRKKTIKRLREIYPVSCRVYGPKHCTSKAIKEMLAYQKVLGYLEVLSDPNQTDHVTKHLVELYKVSRHLYGREHYMNTSKSLDNTWAWYCKYYVVCFFAILVMWLRMIFMEIRVPRN